jgi:hypothetical protein
VIEIKCLRPESPTMSYPCDIVLLPTQNVHHDVVAIVLVLRRKRAQTVLS